MAIFNPQIQPTGVPDYSSYSRVVEAPQANKTVGQALSLAGDAIEGGVKLADTWVKADINEEVRQKVETERDKYTAALEAKKAETELLQLKGSGKGDPSLVDKEDTAPVPPSLESGITGATMLGEANAQGKMNDTMYTARLTAIAKQLRAQYPGYVDYIDERISKISGMDPANAYYKNLMQDINYAQAKAAGAANKDLTLADRYLYIPGVAAVGEEMRTKGVTTENSARLRGMISDYLVKDEARKSAQADLALALL